MKLFKDLIEELKEENLIEQTVIETSLAETELANAKSDAANAKALPPVQEARTKKELTGEAIPKITKQVEENAFQPSENPAANVPANAPEPKINGADFYRKRAMQEVSFLQMVEAVFESIEREQLKIVPKPFDDLIVKKALHSFLQVNGDADSPEHSQAQFQLLQETESWYSSLSLRDNRILTANLRRYLETSRPPLSSPALIALARFYRNSPCSEQIRSKFDLVITRLFTNESVNSRREMVFTRDELIVHLKELYADWSSVSLYSIETNDAAISQTAHRFEDFMTEAGNAKLFDDLIAADFFNRLRLFKEEANENFYAPQITAMGIECNVRVGNRYIELLEKEKGMGNVVGLGNKYGFLHDNSISEATGKTLSLLELLKQKAVPVKPVEEKPAAIAAPVVREEIKEKKKPEEIKVPAPASKKWVVAATLLLAAGIILAVYFGTKSSPPPVVRETPAAPQMNLENSMLKEYLSKADIVNETLEGVVLPTWNHLTEEKKRDILKQMLNFGGEKGYKKVRLVDMDGKTVGTAADGEMIVQD